MIRYLIIILSIQIVQFNIVYGQNYKSLHENTYLLNHQILKKEFYSNIYLSNPAPENNTKLLYIVPLQAVSGTLLGAVFFALPFVASNVQTGADHKDVILPATIACIGYTLGIALGIHAVGNTFSLNGSFISTWIGSALGFLSSYFFIHKGTNINLFYTLITTPLGALIGYYTSRRKKSRALINFSKINMKFGLPGIYLTPGSIINDRIKENINLLSISF